MSRITFQTNKCVQAWRIHSTNDPLIFFSDVPFFYFNSPSEEYICRDFPYDFQPPLGEYQYYYLRPLYAEQQPVTILHVGLWMEM